MDHTGSVSATPAPAASQSGRSMPSAAWALGFWAREGRNRILTILVDTERLVSLLVSFVSVHHGPGYGGS